MIQNTLHPSDNIGLRLTFLMRYGMLVEVIICGYRHNKRHCNRLEYQVHQIDRVEHKIFLSVPELEDAQCSIFAMIDWVANHGKTQPKRQHDVIFFSERIDDVT